MVELAQAQQMIAHVLGSMIGTVFVFAVVATMLVWIVATNKQ